MKIRIQSAEAVRQERGQVEEQRAILMKCPMWELMLQIGVREKNRRNVREVEVRAQARVRSALAQYFREELKVVTKGKWWSVVR